jgi:hypothetical protein
MKKKDTREDSPNAVREINPITPAQPLPEQAQAAMPIPGSGLYTARVPIAGLEGEGIDTDTTGTAGLLLRSIEELRLDVDGHFPQMVASGLVRLSIASRIHWIANLKPSGPDSWAGGISYKEGATFAFPYTSVEIRVTKPSPFSRPKKATVILSGTGIADRVRVLKYRSPYFHKVEFEFDAAETTTPITQIQTHDHPNRPASLPDEVLGIDTVYRRAGFDVNVSASPSVIPLPPGTTWSDMEMHDAMQSFWSRFANRPQWVLWVLFASLHESGTSLGGIMFDDIGPNERQGTALFLDSFISSAPAGDLNPQAWVRRMGFWTACHEMGHAFNLAHSWQKSLSAGNLGPWVPLADEPEARSFMNYPFRVAGGQAAFFADFEFRFTDSELLYMRHAPGRFVQMGNADWFDNHGFRQANLSPQPAYRLEIRVNRPNALFEFMEPVMLELKLTNLRQQPQLIPDDLLMQFENLTIIVKKDGRPARQFAPFARYCTQAQVRSLQPGESIYEPVFVSADRLGWGVAEPGYYRLQAALHLQEEDIVSAPLNIRVAPPRAYEEEYLAQDYFSKDVGRVLAFDGTRFLTKSSDTLRQVTEKLPDRKVTRHAHIALGTATARPYKHLTFGESPDAQPSVQRPATGVQIQPPDMEEANRHLSAALTENMEISAESLGHIDFKYYVDLYAELLAAHGEKQEAARVQTNLHRVMAARGVLETVLRDIKTRAEQYASSRAARSSG